MCVCVCVCKSVHDSLMVGVERAAALHAKLTPQAARVSTLTAQGKDNTVGWRSWITVPLVHSNTLETRAVTLAPPHPVFLDFYESFQLHLIASIVAESEEEASFMLM